MIPLIALMAIIAGVTLVVKFVGWIIVISIVKSFIENNPILSWSLMTVTGLIVWRQITK